MTSLYQEPETPQLLQRTDSPIVGNALVERDDISAGDSFTSPLPGSERSAEGPRTAEVAAITPLRSSDFDALATLPQSLRARWQQRYGKWLVASDLVVVAGVVAAAVDEAASPPPRTARTARPIWWRKKIGIATRPAMTPAAPSKFPPLATESRCDPVIRHDALRSRPASVMKRLAA